MLLARWIPLEMMPVAAVTLVPGSKGNVLLARRLSLEMMPVAVVAVVPGSEGNNVFLARRFPLEIMPVAAVVVVPAYCSWGELDVHLDSACNILVAIDRAPQEG